MRSFPDFDADNADRAQSKGILFIYATSSEPFLQGVKYLFGHHLGGGIDFLKGNDPAAESFVKNGKRGVLGVHAHGVIVGFEMIGGKLFDQLEVADHFTVVERVGFESQLNFSGVTVGEPALVRVLAQDVPALDFKNPADSVCHAHLFARAGGKARSNLND